MENCVAPGLDEFDVLLEVVLSLVRVLALIYAKVAGRPGTGSYPAPSPSPTTQA